MNQFETSKIWHVISINLITLFDRHVVNGFIIFVIAYTHHPGCWLFTFSMKFIFIRILNSIKIRLAGSIDFLLFNNKPPLFIMGVWRLFKLAHTQASYSFGKSVIQTYTLINHTTCSCYRISFVFFFLLFYTILSNLYIGINHTIKKWHFIEKFVFVQTSRHQQSCN